MQFPAFSACRAASTPTRPTAAGNAQHDHLQRRNHPGRRHTDLGLQHDLTPISKAPSPATIHGMRGRSSGPPLRLRLHTTSQLTPWCEAVGRCGTSSIPKILTAKIRAMSRNSSAVAIPPPPNRDWKLPSRGMRGHALPHHRANRPSSHLCRRLFYYIGKSLTGPTPQVLEFPIFTTVCLLSSSITVLFAAHALQRGRVRSFGAGRR